MQSIVKHKNPYTRPNIEFKTFAKTQIFSLPAFLPASWPQLQGKQAATTA